MVDRHWLFTAHAEPAANTLDQPTETGLYLAVTLGERFGFGDWGNFVSKPAPPVE